jgi:hypothetical protein
MPRKSQRLSLRPPPAFQEYPSDWLASRTFRECNLLERGLLMTMRFECWVNQSLPKAPDSLAQVLGLPREVLDASLTPRVFSFFSESNDVLICPELESYRERLVNGRQAMSEGGRRGGRRTQERHRENEATLERTLKPLSRDELNGDEWNGKASTGSGEIKQHSEDPWVRDYDEYSQQEVQNLERSAKGKSSDSRGQR